MEKDPNIRKETCKRDLSYMKRDLQRDQQQNPTTETNVDPRYPNTQTSKYTICMVGLICRSLFIYVGLFSYKETCK